MVVRFRASQGREVWESSRELWTSRVWTVNLVEEGRLMEKTCNMVRLILLTRGGGGRARNQSWGAGQEARCSSTAGRPRLVTRDCREERSSLEEPFFRPCSASKRIPTYRAVAVS